MCGLPCAGSLGVLTRNMIRHMNTKALMQIQVWEREMCMCTHMHTNTSNLQFPTDLPIAVTQWERSIYQWQLRKQTAGTNKSLCIRNRTLRSKQWNSSARYFCTNINHLSMVSTSYYMHLHLNINFNPSVTQAHLFHFSVIDHLQFSRSNIDFGKQPATCHIPSVHSEILLLQFIVPSPYHHQFWNHW